MLEEDHDMTPMLELLSRFRKNIYWNLSMDFAENIIYNSDYSTRIYIFKNVGRMTRQRHEDGWDGYLVTSYSETWTQTWNSWHEASTSA